jgi:hypothetical protein
MKKIVVVLSVIASFFFFQSALAKYDMLIFNKLATYSPKGETFYLAVSGALSDGEAKSFHSALIRLLEEYDVNCYQSLMACLLLMR